MFLDERVLGHSSDKEVLHVDQSKLKGIQEVKEPATLSKRRSFLGMVNFYSMLISRASTLLTPLYLC